MIKLNAIIETYTNPINMQKR